jgi:DNA recombination protein RmuC
MEEALIEFILLGTIGLLAIIGYILIRRTQAIGVDANLQKHDELVNEIDRLHTEIERHISENGILSQENVRLQTQIEEKQKANEEKVQLLEQSEVRLKKEFENLANKIFEEKGKSFSNSSQSSLDAMLRPFKDQIDGFQKRVNEVHMEAIKGNTNLVSEIKKYAEVGTALSEDAKNLTAALKGDSQYRGAWGEAQLERTLQMSGLVEVTHYTKQDSFSSGGGAKKQTDFIIYLPNGGGFIIDSKMTLLDYDRAISAKSDEEAMVAMTAHVTAVKKYINDLSRKDYPSIANVQSPDFTFLFMPIEPAFIEALKHDKGLFSYGYEKNVILVSHTTLIPILRVISAVWTLYSTSNHATELGDKAMEIYNSVCEVSNRTDKLGNSLKAAGNHWNSLRTALIGNQGLAGKIERFATLSTKTKSEMVNMEHIQIGDDDARLQLKAKTTLHEDFECASDEDGE